MKTEENGFTNILDCTGLFFIILHNLKKIHITNSIAIDTITSKASGNSIL